MRKGASLWVYFGPLVLAILEFIARNLMHCDPIEFLGPTLAAAAVAMLFPLTAVRTFRRTPAGFIRFSTSEVQFVWRLYFVIVIMGIGWLVDLCVALDPESLGVLSVWLHVHRIGPMIIAGTLYLLAIGFSEYKEGRW